VLLDDNGPDPPSGQDFKMTVVVDTKGLNFVQRELNKIKARVPNDSLVLLGLPDAPAHIEVILSLLSTSSVVHFACHGKQDKFKPLNSALFVDDGRLEISRIIQQPLPNGSLAFLSACETAMGDSHLPDEAMSLGASLLFSGFRHVIATMW
jgi:CHAT domain-containing protein